MFRKLKEIFTFISHAPPGERFISYYRLRKKRRRDHPAFNLVYILTGIGLVVAGASLSLVPGVPGIVLGIPGLAMLAARSRTFARILDFTEACSCSLYRRIARKQSRRSNKSKRP